MTLDKETLLEAAEICGYERERWQSSREELPDDVSGAQDACDNLARTFTKLAAQQPESSREAVLEERLLMSLRSGFLFESRDEPLNDYGKRIVRVIAFALNNAGGQELPAVTSASRQESTTGLDRTCPRQRTATCSARTKYRSTS